jgi:type IV pilus assembly protein PilE
MKSRITAQELLTAFVLLVVIAAIAVPMWRTHQLRIHRQDAMSSLRALQAAQDDYFGKYARYASEAQLRASAPHALSDKTPSGKSLSRRGYYQLTLHKSDDDFSYTAVARVVPLEGQTDTRCVELRIDQNGRRYAVDAQGVDRSADCWG